MDSLPNNCPVCKDKDILVTDQWLVLDEVLDTEVEITSWILRAGNVNVKISYCPFCGSYLPDDFLETRLG